MRGRCRKTCGFNSRRPQCAGRKHRWRCVRLLTGGAEFESLAAQSEVNRNPVAGQVVTLRLIWSPCRFESDPRSFHRSRPRPIRKGASLPTRLSCGFESRRALSSLPWTKWLRSPRFRRGRCGFDSRRQQCESSFAPEAHSEGHLRAKEDIVRVRIPPGALIAGRARPALRAAVDQSAGRLVVNEEGAGSIPVSGVAVRTFDRSNGAIEARDANASGTTCLISTRSRVRIPPVRLRRGR